MTTSIDQIDENLAIRNLPEGDVPGILKAALVASDHGMLLTDLDLGIIAVNRRFGEIFGVTPQLALDLGMEPLRTHLRPLVRNPEAWMRVTNAIYREPQREYEDVIELFRGRRMVLRRYSGPVRDASGSIVGRLWTYRDVTQEVRLREVHEKLHAISEAYDPDPSKVLKKILKVVSDHFDTTAILSMSRGDQMDFRIVIGPNRDLSRARGIPLQQSYCQFALSSQRPIIIQNSAEEPDYCEMGASKSGLTRYLGVPILGGESLPIGTLCFVDGRSAEPLDDLDLQFMAMLAARVSAELARERHIQERLADKESQIERQRADLAATQTVFGAMIAAFGFLGSTLEADQLVSRQTHLLKGLLGYQSSAVLIRGHGESKFRGFASLRRSPHPTAVRLEGFEVPNEISAIPGFLSHPKDGLSTRLRAEHLAFVRRMDAEVGEILIALGRRDEPPTDERHRGHLEAMFDQVCLLLATHCLQSKLLATNDQLADTQAQLLQKEKLSVVGTLAASTAHDIRNITASLGLLASPSACPAEETLAEIREQLGRFDVLAHRLLSYAKPRSIGQERVDLAKVIDEVLNLTAAHTRIADVEVLRRGARSLPRIVGDPHQLQHLFVNLILNAVQSMNRTGGNLTIDTRIEPDFICVRIADTGPGLSRSILERLFEPFASSRADGFGLGLYSCKRIVEAHRGTIRASNLPKSGGSAFTVRLPLSEVAR